MSNEKIPTLITPGPTAIHTRVLQAAAKPITNPDLDPQFFTYFQGVTHKLKRLFNTTSEVIVMCGEAILGLEAACASFIEPGDRILCIDNGIFGNGFGDFAKMYGAQVVYFTGDYRHGIDVDALSAFLESDSNFKLATLVHCETPTGISNPVDLICPLLHRHGILSIVDSVSALGGEVLKTDAWQMDVVIGGTQKCLSAAPGLTLISLSASAIALLKNRKTPYPGFYTNLSLYLDWLEKKWFVYTQPISAIYQLEVAVDMVLEEPDILTKHAHVAKSVREAFQKAGFELYAKDCFSNTVTAVQMPNGISYEVLFDELLNTHGILIAGSLGELKGKLFRVGHMGNGCDASLIQKVFFAMDEVFKTHGVSSVQSLSPFIKN